MFGVGVAVTVSGIVALTWFRGRQRAAELKQENEKLKLHASSKMDEELDVMDDPRDPKSLVGDPEGLMDHGPHTGHQETGSSAPGILGATMTVDPTPRSQSTLSSAGITSPSSQRLKQQSNPMRAHTNDDLTNQFDQLVPVGAWHNIHSPGHDTTCDTPMSTPNWDSPMSNCHSNHSPILSQSHSPVLEDRKQSIKQTESLVALKQMTSKAKLDSDSQQQSEVREHTGSEMMNEHEAEELAEIAQRQAKLIRDAEEKEVERQAKALSEARSPRSPRELAKLKAKQEEGAKSMLTNAGEGADASSTASHREATRNRAESLAVAAHAKTNAKPNPGNSESAPMEHDASLPDSSSTRETRNRAESLAVAAYAQSNTMPNLNQASNSTSASPSFGEMVRGHSSIEPALDPSSSTPQGNSRRKSVDLGSHMCDVGTSSPGSGMKMKSSRRGSLADKIRACNKVSTASSTTRLSSTSDNEDMEAFLRDVEEEASSAVTHPSATVKVSKKGSVLGNKIRAIGTPDI